MHKLQSISNRVLNCKDEAMANPERDGGDSGQHKVRCGFYIARSTLFLSLRYSMLRFIARQKLSRFEQKSPEEQENERRKIKEAIAQKLQEKNNIIAGIRKQMDRPGGQVCSTVFNSYEFKHLVNSSIRSSYYCEAS